MAPPAPRPLVPPPVPTSEWTDARLLAVDDEAVNLALLRALLARAGYERVETLDDPLEAAERVRADPPDLLLTDLHMPRLSGLELLDALHEGARARGTWVPALVLTVDGSDDAEREALGRGATDFLHKPFRSHPIRLRVRNLLHARRMHLALQERNRELERRVRERAAELEAARRDALERVAAEIRARAGSRFDPRVVEAFLALLDEHPELEAMGRRADGRGAGGGAGGGAEG